MHKFLVIAVGAVLLIALGMAIQSGWSSMRSTTETNTVATVSQNSTPSTATTNKQPVSKKQGSGQGPWQRYLKISTATTMAGLGQQVTTFEERSGVPSLTVGTDGTLYAAFQWFPENDNSNFDKVAIKTSTDNGLTWSEPTPINVSGLPEGYQRPFDPTLVTLADGRLRLYFTSSPEQLGPGTSRQTYSAVSLDSNYAFEYEYEGLSLSLATDQAYDSGVALLDNVWHMFTPGGEEFVGANHATSTDGVAFTLVDQITNPAIDDKKQSWIGNLFGGNDGIGFVGGGSPIWYMTTSDGTTWSAIKNLAVNGGDPTVARALDGTYLLIFVSETVR